MPNDPWFQYFPGAITITDENATILAMNAESAETFKSSGGRELIGRSVIDCHPPAVQDKVRALYQTREPNVYTIEKQGRKKLIYQAPVYRDGELIGVVELGLPLPEEIPHFRRD
jgi:transcriptional regulator with PAS, ATPase and Fis domain